MLSVYAERIVSHLRLGHHFRKVYGAELDGRWDDKAELLAYLLATEGVRPSASVMVGDPSDEENGGSTHLLRVEVEVRRDGATVAAGSILLARTP